MRYASTLLQETNPSTSNCGRKTALVQLPGVERQPHATETDPPHHTKTKDHVIELASLLLRHLKPSKASSATQRPAVRRKRTTLDATMNHGSSKTLTVRSRTAYPRARVGRRAAACWPQAPAVQKGGLHVQSGGQKTMEEAFCGGVRRLSDGLGCASMRCGCVCLIPC